ncbi:MAG: glycosyl hydrolase [Bacteroidia bacterium 43-41]|mgnify:CR=1 FL=1|nr:MAG: glycosyl hydrolase [Bacteroidia bacterium 43-41]
MKQYLLFMIISINIIFNSCNTNNGYNALFKDDLSNADYNTDIWTYKDGVLTASADEAIWTINEYENFILDLEFKNDVNTNSGVIIYCPDKENWVPSSIEIQIADDHHEFWQSLPENARCGSIYGHKGANEQLVVKKPGLWNHMVITAKGQQITIELNGKKIVNANLSDWTSGTKNPDGTDIPEWLPKPYAELQTKGYIGFQGKHGKSDIWFKNIKIKQI